MSGMKGGGLLLILGIPLAGYCALQVKGVLRTDLVASEAPPDRGAPKEQLAASHAKSAAWLGEVRKAAAVAAQYRAATPEDASPDPACAGVVKASAARAADLNDLDLFLSEVERPAFAGRLKGQYEKWLEERRELRRDEAAVAEWLGRPPVVGSAAEAAKAVGAANALITQYATRSRFSDTAKAAVWRLKARLAVADALAALSDSQYRAAVLVRLPLEPGNNAAKTAVETLRGLQATVAALASDLAAAGEDKKLDPALRAAVEARGAVADECAAREELLALFAQEDLFTNAAGAPAWLKQVGAQYRRTKDEKVRRIIRDKVQEFCEAFIPAAARLDDKVLLKGKPVDRAKVAVKFNPVGGKLTREPLSGDLDGLNEFNLKDRRPGTNTFVVYEGSEEYPRDLVPTELSRAAVLFNAERKRLSDSPSAPRWGAKSVEELKNKCEPRKDLVDQLQPLGGGAAGKEPKIWARLTGLAAGAAANADLFEAAP